MRAVLGLLGLALVGSAASCIVSLDGLAEPGAGGKGGSGGASCSQNLATDPKNCGACGQDCRGGQCMDGSCQPVLVAKGQQVTSPWGLALSGDTLYWTVQGSADVRSVNATSGAEPVALGAAYGGAGALAADDMGLFYASAAGIARCSLAGVCDPGIYASDNTSSVRAIALDATNVYWTDAATSMNDGRLWRCDRAANDCATSAVLMAQGLAQPDGLTLADQYVYWAERGLAGSVPGRVARLDVTATAATSPTVMMTSPDEYRGVLVTATHVFATRWSQPDAIVSCALPCASAAPTVLAKTGATVVAGPIALGIDRDDLYWTNSGGSTVSFCDVKSCAPEDNATDRPKPMALVVDSVELYWTDALGNIWRLVY